MKSSQQFRETFWYYIGLCTVLRVNWFYPIQYSMRILPIQIRHVNVSDETLLLGEQVPEELATASMGPFGIISGFIYCFTSEFVLSVSMQILYYILEDFNYSNKAF